MLYFKSSPLHFAAETIFISGEFASSLDNAGYSPVHSRTRARGRDRKMLPTEQHEADTAEERENGMECVVWKSS